MPVESWRANLTSGKGGYWGVVASSKDETDKEWLAFLEAVGESLRTLRSSQGWSQRNLGNLMGYRTASMVSNLEKARTPGVTLYRIWRTAHFMGYKTRIVFEKKERR